VTVSGRYSRAVSARSTQLTGSVAVPGGRLAYDVSGRGPAVVLIHAGIGDRRMWDDVMPLFALHRTVIRYDTRGYGATTMSEPVGYSNRQDLIDLLDHLGVDRAALVGASRGGTIALDTTLEQPDRVAALVCVAGGVSGFDGGATDEEQALADEMERLEDAREWERLVESEARFWVDGVGGSPDRVPNVRRRVMEMNLAAYRNHGEEPLERAHPLEPPAVARLGEVQVPTLVIVGELDASASRASARAIADGVGAARLVTLPGVTHLPSMEVPDRFVELVESFLTDAGA
jgi:3-oxoadipate enol-lactonase